MYRPERLPVLAGLVMFGLIAAGSTAAADDKDTCLKSSGDVAIAACTRAINARAGNQSTMYNNRGVAYRSKEDNDHAIADYSEAIRIDPKSAIAYRNRGVTYSKKSDL